MQKALEEFGIRDLRSGRLGVTAGLRGMPEAYPDDASDGGNPCLVHGTCRCRERREDCEMSRTFNITADCKPSLHYMVDISDRLEQIKKMIDDGKYFTINRARQYGKTTTLRAG